MFLTWVKSGLHNKSLFGGRCFLFEPSQIAPKCRSFSDTFTPKALGAQDSCCLGLVASQEKLCPFHSLARPAACKGGLALASPAPTFSMALPSFSAHGVAAPRWM